MKWGKMGRGWLLSFKLEFKTKAKGKIFAFSDEEDMIWASFIIAGTVAFSLFIILMTVIQNFLGPI